MPKTRIGIYITMPRQQGLKYAALNSMILSLGAELLDGPNGVTQGFNGKYIVNLVDLGAFKQLLRDEFPAMQFDHCFIRIPTKTLFDLCRDADALGITWRDCFARTDVAQVLCRDCPGRTHDCLRVASDCDNYKCNALNFSARISCPFSFISEEPNG